MRPKSDGSLDCYKASLVALGYRQNYGIDYGETIFLVTKMTTVMTPIAIDAAKSWPLFQMDVKNAFQLQHQLICFSSSDNNYMGLNRLFMPRL